MSAVLERLSAALADRYRIERELGQGGMATVYLAEDLKHKRHVALKVLKPELAAVLGAERFVQEIATTAALQHPHILPLFDSGTADGFLFYVMPFIDGETLRAKLDRETQLGVDEAVQIARDVAGALDYAHRHGVIHRDIKPENILLHEGRPMVADFGIALAVSAAAGGRMTETGLSLGTPHYMSPEQATAEREISARSDVYSLASVLYEMLAGAPPHLGGSAQQIIMKIVTEEAAPVTRVRKTVPQNVAAAVAKALQKLPADRFESAAQFSEALANRAYTTGAMAAQAGSSPEGGRGKRIAGIAVGAAVVLGALAAVGWLRPTSAPEPSRQRVVLWETPFLSLLTPGVGASQTQATIAPDGSSIVFVDSVGGNSVLMRKLRQELRAVPLAGTEGASSPFFSPDGAWVAYTTQDGRIRKVPVGGGGSVTIAQDGHLVYHTVIWLDDDTLLYVDNAQALRRVPGNGGTGVVVEVGGSDAAVNFVTLWPLPESQGILFTACPGNCAISSNVYGFRFGADSARLLVPDAAGVWYAPGGHLLYTDRAGGLYAAQLDLGQMALRAGAVPVIEEVAPTSFVLSPSGTALYRVGSEGDAAAELVWVSRDGRTEPVDSAWTGRFDYPALSPDGQAIAVSIRGEVTELWVRRSDGTRQKLTQAGTVNWRPAWAPDGRSLVYISNGGTAGGLNDNAVFRLQVDQNAPPALLLRQSYGAWEAVISQDSTWLVFRTDDQGGNANLRARRLRGDTAIVDLAVSPALETQVALSPDGRWMAYASTATGQPEVYVASFPDMDVTRQVSQGGGTEPRWSRDGRELFFKNAGNFLVVPVPPGPVFAPGVSRVLFSLAGYRSARNRQQYDVAPDGQRFLMIRERRTNTAGSVVYVENWLQELNAKMKQ